MIRDRNLHYKKYMFLSIVYLSIASVIIYKYFSSAPAVYANEGKVIYLTFDDGPSFTATDEILNILKEKGVKATFFVVGNKIQGKERVLKRINAEGHSIGLHSYTHQYKKVYLNADSFIDEMDKTSAEVKRVAGVSPHIIRFPGGSKPYLNNEFLTKLHIKRYKIFDWNACLSDGLNCATSPDKLFSESINVIGDTSNIILLMHCDEQNKNTIKVLPKIISYYKEHGYQFKIITDDTPEFYFKFNI